MSNYNFKDREGNTPIDLEQLEGIKYSHVTTMGELDELEDLNIQKGIDWLNHQGNINFLTITFLNKLHKKLFGDVWSWAGKHRNNMVNLSTIDHFNIGPELINLFKDLKVWIEHGEMNWDEISAEFHHKLVSIHPFRNGNGRVARIMTEFLQKKNAQKVSSWKASLKPSPKERRRRYISALQKADKGDYLELIDFLSEKNTD